MKFTIETVAKMTGISAASLRNWEKRYGFPRPERTEAGRRYYTLSDIQFLKKASKWMCEGLCLTELAKFYLKEVLKSDNGATEPVKNFPDSVGVGSVTNDIAYRTEMLYESLLKFDQTSALQHYSILNVKLGPEKLFDKVFEPILHRLGLDQCSNKISIAQEHFASAFIRLRLASFLAIEYPTAHNNKILCATLSHEHHEGGLMLVAAHLKFKGYPIYYAGVDLPIQELKILIMELNPDVVCISYSQKERLFEDFSELESLKVPVCIGGFAIYGCCEKLSRIKQDAASNLHFCDHGSGAEAAQYVEALCCRKQ